MRLGAGGLEPRRIAQIVEIGGGARLGIAEPSALLDAVAANADPVQVPEEDLPLTKPRKGMGEDHPHAGHPAKPVELPKIDPWIASVTAAHDHVAERQGMARPVCRRRIRMKIRAIRTTLLDVPMRRPIVSRIRTLREGSSVPYASGGPRERESRAWDVRSGAGCGRVARKGLPPSDKAPEGV